MGNNGEKGVKNMTPPPDLKLILHKNAAFKQKKPDRQRLIRLSKVYE